MLKNVHLIRVSFKAATENDGDSIVLKSERFTGNKIEISPYHPIDTNICNIAEDWLTKNGYQPIFKAEGKRCYFIACEAKDGIYFKKLKKS